MLVVLKLASQKGTDGFFGTGLTVAVHWRRCMSFVPFEAADFTPRSLDTFASGAGSSAAGRLPLAILSLNRKGVN